MSEARHFKDHHREARLLLTRALVAGAFVVLLMGILVARYYSLQITQHSNYVTESKRNRVHLLPIAPTRGLIYDRKGKLLAENRASYTLSIVPERAGNLSKTLNLLSSLIDISATDVEKFNDQLRQRRRPFDAVPLRYNLTEKEIAKLAVNEFRLNGTEVDAQLVRHYTHGKLFAHTIGYVGRISERELSGFSEQQYQRYSGTHSIGKTGLEKYYESQLLGQVGYQNVETNARGRVLRVLDRAAPKPGKNLTLTLDTQLQKVAYKALGKHRGALIALDVHTGQVLAAASAPSFDANLFVTGISFNNYRKLNQSHDLPLFNRFLKGQYPPGSTVKPMMGMAGLHYGIITPDYTIFDPGYYQLEGSDHRYRDWKRYGHGKVNLKKAITQSCDTYFYNLGFKMGVDKMHAFGQEFGLGAKTHIDLPGERSGLWPSRQWKRKARHLPWFPGDNLNMAIGQGYVLLTPLQLAVMAATIANHGTRMKPYLVSRIGDKKIAPQVVQKVDVSEKDIDIVIAGMENVMNGAHGTARRVGRGADFHMAGKSGTAQVVSIAQGEEYDSEELSERNRDHALFIAFAPVENPQIAVAVLVENAESGSGTAAPMTRKVIESWLHRHPPPKPHKP